MEHKSNTGICNRTYPPVSKTTHKAKMQGILQGKNTAVLLPGWDDKQNEEQSLLQNLFKPLQMKACSAGGHSIRL